MEQLFQASPFCLLVCLAIQRHLPVSMPFGDEVRMYNFAQQERVLEVLAFMMSTPPRVSTPKEEQDLMELAGKCCAQQRRVESKYGTM